MWIIILNIFIHVFYIFKNHHLSSMDNETVHLNFCHTPNRCLFYDNFKSEIHLWCICKSRFKNIGGLLKVCLRFRISDGSFIVNNYKQLIRYMKNSEIILFTIFRGFYRRLWKVVFKQMNVEIYSLTFDKVCLNSRIALNLLLPWEFFFLGHIKVFQIATENYNLD